jgi:hypothetical protein
VAGACAERQKQIARAFSHDDINVHLPNETPSVVGTTVFVIVMTAVWVVIILGVVGVIH